jgi:hypothetical protein
MALGDRVYQDPVLSALGQLNEGLRGATKDILTRRQLDLQNQQLLNQGERQAQLAGVELERTKGEGAVNVLKTRGDIAYREGEAQRAERGLASQLETAASQRETWAQQREHAATKLPYELRESEANIRLRGAQAGAAGESAALARAQRQQLNKPVSADTLGALVGVVAGGGGQEVVDRWTKLLNVGNIKNNADLQNVLEMASKVDPDKMTKVGLNLMEGRLASLPENAPERRALLQQRERALENLGRARATQAASPEAAYESRMAEITNIFEQATYGRASPEAVAQATTLYESQANLGRGMFKKDLPDVHPFTVRQFGEIAKKTLAANKVDLEQNPNALSEEIKRLGREYGLASRFLEVTRAQQAANTPQAPATAGQAPAPSSSGLIIDPELAARRKEQLGSAIQRGTEGATNLLRQTPQANAIRAQYQRLIQQGFPPEGEEAYVQMRLQGVPDLTARQRVQQGR